METIDQMITNIYRENNSRLRYTHFAVAVLVVLSFILLSSSTSSILQFNLANDCLVSFGQYHGHKYSSVTTIGKGRCLVQSKWMQVMQVSFIHNHNFTHQDVEFFIQLISSKINTPSSSFENTLSKHKVQLDKNTIIDDWLFIDYHDRINVLVEDPKSKESNEMKFLILRQTKYALEGKESLAIVGGIIEPHEDAPSAAKREVNEELGLDCKFKVLGRFRTDVNRGMGWVNSFLAYDCEKKASSGQNDFDPTDEVGTKDVERQDVISLTLDEVKRNVKDGKFVEVQWSNTVALAMLAITP